MKNNRMITTKQILGRWKNSKIDTKGIAEFTLESRDNKLSLLLIGEEGSFLPNSIDWIEATGHASDNSSLDCIAFKAETTIDGKDYFFAGNVNKGLIIIATYVEESEVLKSNFFLREFFYKLK